MGWNSKARKKAEEDRRKEDARYQERYEEELKKIQSRKKRPLRDLGVFLIAALLLIALGGGIYLFNQSHATDEAKAITALADSEGVANGVKVSKLQDGYLLYEPVSSTHSQTQDTGVIFYPGGKVESDAYAPLLQKLAAQGVTCVAVTVPFNLSMLNTNAADGVAQQVPQVSTWYVMGHSLGGVSASSYAAAHTDSVTGCIFLASYPSDDLSGSGLRTLSIYGTEDGVMNRDNYESAKTLLPADSQEMVIQGGNHAQFGNYGKQDHDNDASITADDQQQQAVNTIISFLTNVSA
ncbi:MAG: alpha/beta hydrolase [Eggerthellales bacterium]|nr:alpha/beta hydrolase [Eggerthellales bacterium]